MTARHGGAPVPVGTRGKVRRWWDGAQWVVVLSAGLVAIVLGLVGWTRYFDAIDAPTGPADVLYATIQLFTLQVSAVPDGPSFPAELQVAKFVAPVVAGYAAARALLAVFHETTQQLGVRFARDHVVVVGLGDVGLTLTRRLRARRQPVVAIEARSGAEGIRSAIDAGARVLVGDARDPELLERAGVDRARHVVIRTDDDEVGGQVAAAVVARRVDGRDAPLDCHLVLHHPGLGARLRAADLAGPDRDGVDLEVLHLDEVAARRLVAEHPPPAGATSALVGAGDLAEAVVLALADRDDGPRHVLVVAPGASGAVDRWQRRHPGLQELVQLEAVDGDPGSPALLRSVAGRHPGQALVCEEADAAALAVALDLVDAGVPTVVALSHDSGLARLAERADGGGRAPLAAFGYVDAITDPDLLLGGLWERLAQSIHDRYRAARAAEGVDDPDDPALRPWTTLDESLRAANRAQARGIGDKAAALGARIVPATSSDDRAPVRIADEDVERLARLEHERWMADRQAAGWTPGPRDPERRTTPFLVPWEDLDEPARDKDRQAVRSIPSLLASAGYRLVR